MNIVKELMDEPTSIKMWIDIYYSKPSGERERCIWPVRGTKKNIISIDNEKNTQFIYRHEVDIKMYIYLMVRKHGFKKK